MKVLIGCFLGVSLGVAVLVGIVELADFMVEITNELSR